MSPVDCQALTDWLYQSDYLLLAGSTSFGFALGVLFHWFWNSIEKSE